MLVNTLNEIGCHANIERPVSLAAEYVDIKVLQENTPFLKILVSCLRRNDGLKSEEQW
jgi:hypothetical protein